MHCVRRIAVGEKAPVAARVHVERAAGRGIAVEQFVFAAGALAAGMHQLNDGGLVVAEQRHIRDGGSDGDGAKKSAPIFFKAIYK